MRSPGSATPLWMACVVSAVAGILLLSADAGEKKPAVPGTPAGKPPATTATGAQKPPQDPRPPFTVAEQHEAVVLDNPQVRFWAGDEASFKRTVGHTKGPWLILSGGGQDGAFGAGILHGWSEAGTRPDFAVVTGVSAGALMAPFAFLGPRYDETLARDSTTITSADVFEAGGAKDALFDTWPLRRLLEKRITPGLLVEIAAEHRKGRRLLVVTTNLDAGRPVVWDMGAIAARGDDDALALFRDVLLASSSIPGLFPPVQIEARANGRAFREMHADGTIAAPFFVAPDSVLSGTGGMKLPATALYIIVNAKLTPEFAMPERETAAVLGRSISVALRAALRSRLAQVEKAARRQGVGTYIAAIDGDFALEATGTFNPDYMQALYAYGVRRSRARLGFRGRPAESTAWQAFVRKLVEPALPH